MRLPLRAAAAWPLRLRLGAGLNEPDPKTYYAAGATGYTDYPFLNAKPTTLAVPWPHDRDQAER